MIVSRRNWIVTVLGGITATLTGCGNSPAPPRTNTEERPLRLLVIDSPEMAAQIERHWRAQSDAPFELTQATSTAARALKRLPVDVVLYPSELLGAFAEAEWIVPLSFEMLDSDDFKRRDLLPQARATEVAWGTNTLAVSLGSPNFNLYYRSDLFERLGLTPPTTWAEYATAATALSNHAALGDAVAAQADWSAVLEPLAPGWAGLTLLTRAAAYARHRSEYAALFHLETMEPLIDHPPFVRALDELVAVAKLGSQAMSATTPPIARQAIYAGRCGMVWTWPTAADSAIASSAAAPTIAIAELPGASDVYNFRAARWETRETGESGRVPLLGIAGRLASVTLAARRPRAAENFLAWLSAGDAAIEIVTASAQTTMYRASQCATPQRFCEAVLPSASATQYATVLEQVQDHAVTLLAPNIPGSEAYRAALDDGVAAALQEGTSVEAALKQVAVAFREITSQRGVAKQRRAYQRSLGLDI